MHRHTCSFCGKVVAEGDFDCEEDRDHDYELCADCAAEQNKLALVAHEPCLKCGRMLCACPEMAGEN